jgi:hypothetical protein
VVSLLAMALVGGCGDDTPSGPNGQAPGPAGELAQALGDAAQQLVASNEASFESLEFFAPFIGGALSAPPAVSGAAIDMSALQQACFPEGALGTTFDFNGTSYAATTQSGAPSNAVRFTLYTLDSSGNPELGSPLGYVDVTCTAELRAGSVTIYDVAFSLDLRAYDVGILSMSMSGWFNLGNATVSISGPGSLTSADGTLSVTFDGGKTGPLGAVGGGFDFSIPPLTATFGRAPGSSSQFFVTVVVRKQEGQSFDWSFDLIADGDASENISGPLNLADPDIGDGVFACVDGPFTGPQVAPSDNCAESGQFQIPDVSDAHRQAVGTAYGALHQMWALLIGTLDTGLDVAIAAATAS